jgi:hypothetical protein
MTKREYEQSIVDTWKTDEETFSVRESLDLELEQITYALRQHPHTKEMQHWLDCLQAYMVYTVSK